jgi:hypothetical protein
MEKYISFFSQSNLSEGMLFLGLVLIAILLIKINGNIKDLKEHFSLGITTRHYDKKN